MFTDLFLLFNLTKIDMDNMSAIHFSPSITHSLTLNI